MAKLAVNVDHVATLRQARMTIYPDPVEAARIAINEGVSGITVHLREDRRHIQEDDVRRIQQLENCKLNLEMAAEEEIIAIAMDIKPNQVTFVPEKREELTTEGGLDIAAKPDYYADLAERFSGRDIDVSFFIDPDPRQIEVAANTRAVAVEINTGRYCDAKTESEKTRTLRQVENAVKTAKALGLIVHAGHGLDYKNVRRIAQMEEIEELNIGHSVVSRAVIVGFALAVMTMKDLVSQSSARVNY